MTTLPIENETEARDFAVVVEGVYKDDQTGATFVHKDLVEVAKPWEEEAHIRPFKASERFGDIDSWVAFVQRLSTGEPPLLTWNSQGLRAILDFGTLAQPGRGQVVATHPFELAPEWVVWTALTASARSQKVAVEFLEDRAPDIVDPDPSNLLSIVRNLRGTVNATADVELRPDGTTYVAYSKDKVLKGSGGELNLPGQFSIVIPVLRGHVGEDGRPASYKLAVRLRVSVGDDGHTTFRFALPQAERTLEEVFSDRVKAAQAALGAELTILRAAG